MTKSDISDGIFQSNTLQQNGNYWEREQFWLWAKQRQSQEDTMWKYLKKAVFPTE